MMSLKNFKDDCAKITMFMLLFAVYSCGGDDPYLYDRTGFDQDARPVVSANPNAPKAVTPDYYRQQQYSPYQHQQQQYQYQQYPNSYQQAPVYGQPVQSYPYQQGGGSRYYSNPYAIPPAAGYYQRYDVDQYYVPPTYYNGGNDQQMKSTGYGY